MSTTRHTTLSGHSIEYEPAPKLAAFLRRLEAMVDDPAVDEQAMIGLAYSHENPMLDQTMHPTRGFVTREIFENPIYSVMTDLLFRKRVNQEGADVDQIAARYSVGVTEAAAQLGVHVSAIHQAIAAKRLASWIKDGRHYLDPSALKSFRVERRGPKPAAAEDESPLEIVLGATQGASMKVRGREQIEKVERVSGNIVRGRLRHWKRVVVMTSGAEGKRRAFVLERGSTENELTHGPFSIKGRFVVAERINAPKRAEEVWKTLEVA